MGACNRKVPLADALGGPALSSADAEEGPVRVGRQCLLVGTGPRVGRLGLVPVVQNCCQGIYYRQFGAQVAI